MTAPLESPADTTTTTEPTTDDGLTAEQLRVELTKVRKEAAGRRVLTREQETQLHEYETWKQSQLTELEKLQKERDEAVKSATALQRERSKEKAAAAAGLDSKFASRLRGRTDEELLADAIELAKSFKAPESNPSLFGDAPGGRGTPAGTNAPKNSESYFRGLFG